MLLQRKSRACEVFTFGFSHFLLPDSPYRITMSSLVAAYESDSDEGESSASPQQSTVPSNASVSNSLVKKISAAPDVDTEVCARRGSYIIHSCDTMMMMMMDNRIFTGNLSTRTPRISSSPSTCHMMT